MEDYFLEFINMLEYIKTKIFFRYKKGSACRSLFWMANTQVRKYYLISISLWCRNN